MKVLSILSRSLTLRSLLLAACLASSGLGASVAAAAPSEISPADAAALTNFKLDEAFLTKWKRMQTGASKDPCHLDVLFALRDQNDDEDDDVDEDAPGKAAKQPKKGRPSLDQSAARYEAQPGAKALLAKTGLSAKDYLLGVVTLVAAAMQQMAIEHPDMASDEDVKADSPVKVNTSSMAFYRSHKEEIHGFMQALNKAKMKRSGGKLPSCVH